MGRSLRWLWRGVLVVAALGSGLASAQAWSIQTVALRDLRQADLVVGQLRALGFDAYDEFAMNDGQQFVRVRVGCFTDRSAAQAAADALAGHVTKQAVPVMLSPGAKVTRCLDEEVGFLKPQHVEPLTRSDGLPAFRITIADHKAEVVFTGAGWRVVQDGATLADAAPTAPTASFAKERPGGAPWVAQQLAEGATLLCPGTLIGEVGSSAVVDRASEVVACRFVAVPVATAEASGP